MYSTFLYLSIFKYFTELVTRSLIADFAAYFAFLFYLFFIHLSF